MTAPIIALAEMAAESGAIEPPTPKWRDALERFYSGGYSELWARVGRRGRKSSTMALIMVYEALQGGHERYVMRNEPAMLVSISVDLKGARVIQEFVKRWLEALSIGCSNSKFGNVDILKIEGSQFVMANLACDADRPRGLAIPVAILDEVAFWETNETYAQPDTQILEALRPAMMQFPDSKLLAISSPFGKEGVFHDTVEAGTTEDTLVVSGPTWEWNPSITEEMTRKDQKDIRVWSREYAAIPSDMVGDAFDADDIRAAFRKPDADLQYCEPVVSIDPSSGKNDAFVWAPVRWAIPSCGKDEPEKPPILVVENLESIDGKFYGTTSLASIAGRITSRSKLCGALRVISDQREALGLQNEFSKHGVSFFPLDWSNSSKVAAVSRLRRLLSEQLIVLPENDDALRKELGEFKQKLLPTGNVTYAARRKGHDDRVAVLLTALIADTQGLLPGSSIGANSGDGFGAIGIGRGSKLDYADSATGDTDYARHCRRNGWKYDPIWDN